MSEEELAPSAENDETQVIPESEEISDEPQEDAVSEAETDTTDTDESDKDEPDKAEKERQRKIAEDAYKERERKRQIRALEKKTAELEAKLQRQSLGGPPKIEDFETIDEYVDAKLEYREKTKSLGEPAPENDQVAEFTYKRDELVSNGTEKHADFVDVVLSGNIPITPVMGEALFEIDDPDLQVDTAYYLGKNPKEAIRIANLSPLRQVAETARLAERLLAKRQSQAKRPSKAPAPIKPVGGTKTTSTEIQDHEEFESFLKKRNRELGRS